MSAAAVVWSVRAIAALVVVIAVLAYFHGFLDVIRAPLEAQLEASRGNQAAMKAGADEQNASIEAAAEEGKRRKEESRKAVEGAGKPAFQRAEAILAKPAAGSTPLERAHRRIDEELGLQ